MKKIILFSLLITTTVMVKSQDLVLELSPDDVSYYKGPIYPGCKNSENHDDIEACFNTLFSNDVVGMFNFSNVDLPPCDYVLVPVYFKVTKNGIIENVQVNYPENGAIQNELLNSINKINSKLAKNNEKIASAVKKSGAAVDFVKRFPIVIKGKGMIQFDEKESIDGEKYFAMEKCGQVLVYKGSDIYNKTLFSTYADRSQFANNFSNDFSANEEAITSEYFYTNESEELYQERLEYERLSKIKAEDLTRRERRRLNELYQAKLEREEFDKQRIRDENEKMRLLLNEKYKQEIYELEKQRKIAKKEHEKLLKLYNAKLKEEQKFNKELRRLSELESKKMDELYKDKIQKEKQAILENQAIQKAEQEKLYKLYNEKVEYEKKLQEQQEIEQKLYQEKLQNLGN